MLNRCFPTLALAVLLLGMACGGGGGGSVPPTPVVTPLSLAQVAPSSGPTGTTVVLTVQGLSGNETVSSVLIGGVQARILAAGYTGAAASISVAVPPGLGSGPLPVQVDVGASSCTAPAAFTLIRSWIAPFCTSGELLQPPDSGDYPLVRMKPDGSALALWMQEFCQNNALWAAFYTPGTGWGPKALLTDRVSQLTPGCFAFDVNASGDAVVLLTGAFLDGTENSGLDGALYVKTYSRATGWSGGTLLMAPIGGIGSASAPGVVLADDGRALALWQGLVPGASFDLTNHVRTSSYSPGLGWSTPSNVDASSGKAVGSLQSPFKAMDGRILVCWEETQPADASPAPTQVVTCEYDWTSGWAAPGQPMAAMGVISGCEGFVGDASGRRLLAWIGGPDDAHMTLQAKQYAPAQGWVPLTAPSPAIPVDPGGFVAGTGANGVPPLSLDMNGTGNAAVGWTSIQGATLRLFDPILGWGQDAALIGPNTIGGNAYPFVAIDGAGNVLTSWVGYSRWTGSGYLSDGLAAFTPAGGTLGTPFRFDQYGDLLINTPGSHLAVDGQGQFQFVWSGADVLHNPGLTNGMFSNAFKAQSGCGTPTPMTTLSFGQGTRPCLAVGSDGRFLAGWSQSERAYQSPWGVSIPAPAVDAATDADLLALWLNRPFAADVLPQGDCTEPCLAMNLPEAPFSGNDALGVMSWLEFHEGHWRLCASKGMDGMSWNLPQKDPNPSGADADQLAIASLATPQVPSMAAYGVFRKTTGTSAHEAWSYTLSNATQAMATTLLSQAGPDVDGLFLATDQVKLCQALWLQLGDRGWQIWTADLDGTTQVWSQPTVLPSAPSGALAPQATLAASGHRLAGWLANQQTELWVMPYDPLSHWGQSLALAQPGTIIQAFDLATDGRTSFAVAWVQGEGASAQAWGRIYQASTGWGVPIHLAVAQVPAVSAKVGMDASGNAVFAVLGGTAPNLEIYAASWTSTQGLAPFQALSDGQGQCGDLLLKVAQPGHALVAWSQVHGGNAQIWASRFY